MVVSFCFINFNLFYNQTSNNESLSEISQLIKTDILVEPDVEILDVIEESDMTILDNLDESYFSFRSYYVGFDLSKTSFDSPSPSISLTKTDWCLIIIGSLLVIGGLSYIY